LLDVKKPAATVAILDASHVTDMRTGAVATIGAKYWFRRSAISERAAT
jgi:ornithine cyclodeaminase/alanine dehydrogenase-like protein (mu-crystallin family)